MNTEHPRYPGFFFVPNDPTDLVELTLEERREMLSDEGVYMVMFADMSHEGQRTDVYCACDNARIPTHRHKDAVKPQTAAATLFGELQTQGVNRHEAFRKVYDEINTQRLYPEGMKLLRTHEPFPCFVEGQQLPPPEEALGKWLTTYPPSKDV